MQGAFDFSQRNNPCVVSQAQHFCSARSHHLLYWKYWALLVIYALSFVYPTPRLWLKVSFSSWNEENLTLNAWLVDCFAPADLSVSSSVPLQNCGSCSITRPIFMSLLRLCRNVKALNLNNRTGESSIVANIPGDCSRDVLTHALICDAPFERLECISQILNVFGFPSLRLKIITFFKLLISSLPLNWKNCC